MVQRPVHLQYLCAFRPSAILPLRRALPCGCCWTRVGSRGGHRGRGHSIASQRSRLCLTPRWLVAQDTGDAFATHGGLDGDWGGGRWAVLLVRAATRAATASHAILSHVASTAVSVFQTDRSKPSVDRNRLLWQFVCQCSTCMRRCVWAWFREEAIAHHWSFVCIWWQFVCRLCQSSSRCWSSPDWPVVHAGGMSEICSVAGVPAIWRHHCHLGGVSRMCPTE